MVTFLAGATKVWPILVQDQIRSGEETITNDDLALLQRHSTLCSGFSNYVPTRWLQNKAGPIRGSELWVIWRWSSWQGEGGEVGWRLMGKGGNPPLIPYLSLLFIILHYSNMMGIVGSPCLISVSTLCHRGNYSNILFGTLGRTSLRSWSISGPHLSEMK